jgi:hypothetical protein
LKAIYAKLHTLEYDIKILNALLSSSQKSTAKKESLTVLTTPRSVTTTHSTIAADKNKNSGKYSEEISDLEENCRFKEKQEDLNRSNTNYDQLIQILNSKKHPMTL